MQEMELEFLGKKYLLKLSIEKIRKILVRCGVPSDELPEIILSKETPKIKNSKNAVSLLNNVYIECMKAVFDAFNAPLFKMEQANDSSDIRMSAGYCIGQWQNLIHIFPLNINPKRFYIPLQFRIYILHLMLHELGHHLDPNLFLLLAHTQSHEQEKQSEKNACAIELRLLRGPQTTPQEWLDTVELIEKD